MSTLSSAKLYGRVALLRRQVQLRQLIRRAIAGSLAVAAIIVTTALATFALFLAIRPPLGELWATLVIAGLYAVTSVVLLAYTLSEPSSPELDALAEMEAAALETVTADAQDATQLLSAVGHRFENFGNSLALGAGILSMLRKHMKSTKS
jgi:hypothetical protein